MNHETIKLGDEEQKLLEEYKILVDHYMHEDRLLEDRSKFLSTVIIALFVAATGFLTSPYFPEKSVVYFLASLGLALCSIWWSIASNSLYYVKLRMLQAIEIEKKLGFTTFQTEWKLCYDRVAVTVGKRSISPLKKRWLMGTATPKILSVVFVILWGMVIIYTLATQTMPLPVDP